MQTRQRKRSVQDFPLIAALFGFPLVDSRVRLPQQGAPGSWLAEFITHHAEPALLSALFRTCRAGRDLVLSSAEHATLRLRPGLEARPRVQLRAAQRALITRGRQTGQTTTLKVVAVGANDLPRIMPLLQAAGTGITKLVIRDMLSLQPTSSEPHGAFLADAAPLLPNLTSLHLQGCICLIPPPNLFPNLRELSLPLPTRPYEPPSEYHTEDYDSDLEYSGPLSGELSASLSGEMSELSGSLSGSLSGELSGELSGDLNDHFSDSDSSDDEWAGYETQHTQAVFASIAPYTPQLTSLSLTREVELDEIMTLGNLTYPWDTLFTSTSHTLTHFSITAALSNQLIKLLVDRCPSVTHLTFYQHYIMHGDNSHLEWGVRHMTVTTGKRFACGHEFNRLPRSREGVGRVDVVFNPEVGCKSVDLKAGTNQGLGSHNLQRLSDFRYHVSFVLVSPFMPGGGADTPEALKNTLQQLSELQTCADAIVRVSRWEWTHETAQMVADALPLLTHLTFDVNMGDVLTDDLLELAFAMGPHLRHLSMGRLGLQSDKWSHMDWPWVSLSMYESESMGALLDLPHPKTYKGEGVPRIAIFDGVYVDSDKDEAERLIDWLQYVQWPGTKFTFTAPPTNPTHLTTQLSILRAVNIPDPEQAKDTIIAFNEGSAVTNAFLDALAGLPQGWGGTLDFRECDWPLQPRQYTRLASCVPPAYDVWSLGSNVTRAVVDQLCKGVERARAGLGLRRLMVCWEGYEGDDGGEDVGKCVWLMPYEEPDPEEMFFGA